MRQRSVLVAGVVAVLALGACGDSGDDASDGAVPTIQRGFTPPNLKPLQELGRPEGELNIVAWAGYTEDGSTDPEVDWVSPFEEKTGCEVTVTTAPTSDEMVRLMKSGAYDVVSASGDASLRLIASGDVEPVNTELVPNYPDVFEALKMRPWNSVGDVSYGVPHGRGANLLMYRTDQVQPAPSSWDVVWEEDSPYAGRITAYDSPIYIADAAVYLMATRPDLGIANPYALDRTQFRAAVDLLEAQRPNVGDYWSDYHKQVEAFSAGDVVVGTTWQLITNLAQAERAPVEAVLPAEGSTGWSDTWMVATRSKHKTCAYRWLDHIISPDVNAAVSEWFGEAPANAKACAETVAENHCEVFHAQDEGYFDRVWYWTTPMAHCVDGRTDVRCTDYGDWTAAWQEITG